MRQQEISSYTRLAKSLALSSEQMAQLLETRADILQRLERYTILHFCSICRSEPCNPRNCQRAFSEQIMHQALVVLPRESLIIANIGCQDCHLAAFWQFKALLKRSET